MTLAQTPNFLRRALLLDAAISGATGALLALGAGFLDSLLGLPAILLREAGIVLLPFAAAVLWLATRASPPRGAVWAVVAINGAWAAASLLLLVSPWVAPTALGYAFVIAQALVVVGFGELQVIGLRGAARVAVA
jgi:hypothetical protein